MSISASFTPPLSNLKARKKARQFLMQALYQYQITGMGWSAIHQQFHHMNDMTKCDLPYFDTLMNKIPQNLEQIDATFEPYLTDRKLVDLNPIECAVIRLGTYELLHCIEIPCRVVLNEAIHLAKEYGSEDGYKYVNGVLNKVARQVRTSEGDWTK
jgi:N utilization substance protein B